MTVYQLFLAAAAAAIALWILRPLLLGGPRLSPAKAAALIEAGQAVLIDVRTPAEWRAGVAQPALLLPLGDLQGPRQQWAPVLAAHRGRTLIVYCASGIRSGTAAALLKQEGFATANLGGYSRWTSAGLPTRRP